MICNYFDCYFNHYRHFQMRAWSCITSYPFWDFPYLAYDNVNPAMVSSMMLRSSMLAFEKVYRQAKLKKKDTVTISHLKKCWCRLLIQWKYNVKWFWNQILDIKFCNSLGYVVSGNSRLHQATIYTCIYLK